MLTHLDSETKDQITQCSHLLKSILGDDFLGMYLYGSAIIGGLQKYSDIDLFIVSERPTTPEEKAKLATSLLSISGIYMKSLKKPIEMTVVVKSEINPWHYPPTFDFQYGDWLRKDFEAGNIEPWPTKEMPDLAILITQILLASKTLYGSTPKLLLCNVPYQDFRSATIHGLHGLMENLDSDTRNVLLTFARIWSTLETDTIFSKPDAATWVTNRLPEELRLVMTRAKAICMGEENESWEDIRNLIRPCAEFILDHINAQLPLEIFSQNNKSIKI